MTEDDTFNRLSRPSHRDMTWLYTDWALSQRPCYGSLRLEEVKNFFIEHKWTIEEYHEYKSNILKKKTWLDDRGIYDYRE